MKIDVYDTYATSKAGKTMHFDVFLPSGGNKETALRYAHAFLESIGEAAGALKSERCNFCHSEQAHPDIEAEIAKSGHYILQMEGCPNRYR
ncbi:MAG: DUF2024 family protein [Hyphomonadaceae bacterium]|nr:DUF2024 family protein [Hyphomonadaceae bacterium]